MVVSLHPPPPIRSTGTDQPVWAKPCNALRGPHLGNCQIQPVISASCCQGQQYVGGGGVALWGPFHPEVSPCRALGSLWCGLCAHMTAGLMWPPIRRPTAATCACHCQANQAPDQRTSLNRGRCVCFMWAATRFPVMSCHPCCTPTSPVPSRRVLVLCARLCSSNNKPHALNSMGHFHF